MVVRSLSTAFGPGRLALASSWRGRRFTLSGGVAVLGERKDSAQPAERGNRCWPLAQGSCFLLLTVGYDPSELLCCASTAAIKTATPTSTTAAAAAAYSRLSRALARRLHRRCRRADKQIGRSQRSAATKRERKGKTSI